MNPNASEPLEVYMVVNFRVSRISRDIRKLTRTFILIKKNPNAKRLIQIHQLEIQSIRQCHHFIANYPDKT
jgi:hypothetical protein